jgi:hypothetical protein
MPNINYLNGQVVDAEIKRADLLIFKVPVDDENHIHFEVRSIPFTGAHAAEWLGRRRERRAKEALNRADLVREVLAGRLHLNDIDPDRTDFVMVEDEIAQTGQGRIPDRGNEHLGRSDTGVILLRKIWERELRALAEGQPTKKWTTGRTGFTIRDQPFTIVRPTKPSTGDEAGDPSVRTRFTLCIHFHERRKRLTDDALGSSAASQKI